MLFRIRVMSENDSHVRVRISTRKGLGSWAMNGFVTFTPEEWKAFKERLEAAKVQGIELIDEPATF